MLLGQYNEYGYMLIDTETGEVVYTAGNCTHCSVTCVDLDSPYCVPLEEILQFCKETGEDMSKDLGTEFAGLEYDERI